MNKRKVLRNLGIEDWVMAFTSLAVFVIGVFDLVEWLSLGTDQMVQIIIVALGILMSANVAQTAHRKTELEGLKLELQKFVGDQVDFKEFSRIEYGIDYMSNKIRAAKTKIDHASISPPIPRYYSSMQNFDQNLEDVALLNQTKIRYLAKPDPYRMQRTQKLINNPQINTYFAKTIASEDLAIPMMNFMIIDNEEIVLVIPGFGEEYKFVSTKSQVIIKSFEAFFNLLWAGAHDIDRSTSLKTKS